MPVLADDDVVMHGDAERPRDVDDCLGHLDVRLRWRRTAGGMVVHEAAHVTYVIDHKDNIRRPERRGSGDWGRFFVLLRDPYAASSPVMPSRFDARQVIVFLGPTHQACRSLSKKYKSESDLIYESLVPSELLRTSAEC
jgi:hypothetical protein